MSYQDIKFEEGTVFLVTGGAGFIGSNLCEALLDMGCNVRCLDDLSTGKYENIEHFMGKKEFAFIEGDIRDFKTCESACEGVDYVLHQAAWGSVPRSMEMPIVYEEINIRGTLNMMEAATQCGVKKFVYASSSSVYGDSTELPKREGQEGKVISPYALTKKTDEEYGRLYKELYGLDTYGLRYFNVFGRRQDPDGAYAAVIPKFIKQLLHGETPTINGDGRQSRDFTNIPVPFLFHHIGAGGRLFLIDMYEQLCQALGVSVEPVFGPPRAGDVRDSNADISKAKKLLGYDPSYDFERGIGLAIDWYREYLK